MKSGARDVLSLVPLALQFIAMCSAIGAISFAARAMNGFVLEHNQSGKIPAPSRLALGHPSAAMIIVVVLFAISVACYVITRSKVKEDADKAAIQNAVYSATWYMGVIFVGGVIMAEFLPYFAFHSR